MAAPLLLYKGDCDILCYKKYKKYAVFGTWLYTCTVINYCHCAHNLDILQQCQEY